MREFDVNMPVQLYALTWSQEDTAAIQQWQDEHADSFYISGWSRILLESLDKAVSDPNIFGLSIDGVIVNSLKNVSEDMLKVSLKKLNAGMLKLYVVEHGIEPIAG